MSVLLFTVLIASDTNAEPISNDDGSVEQHIRTKAKQGDAEAQVNLGMMYANGEGAEGDDKQAALWFHEAADQGEAMAQLNLGRINFNGTGVPRDHAQAYLWTYLAAAQKSEKAINTLDSLFKALTPAQIEEGKKLVRE